MKYLPLYLLWALLLMLIINCVSLTDLDYHLGKSKYGDVELSDEESFHGDTSAELSVSDKGTYIRISVYMDQPISLDDLDLLSMWVDPESGDGQIQFDLFMDGDGDGSYDSKDSNDTRIRSLKESWSERGMLFDEWNELDGFDLTYEKYGDKGFPVGSLESCRERLSGQKVVKLYITLYKDKNVPMTSAFIDYLKIADQIISFEPLEKEAIKDGPASVSPGGTITYTITYGNNLLEPVDLVIREDYDPATSFVKADPEPDPGTTNVWTIRGLSPGKHGQIVVKLATTKPSCKAEISGKVSGSGFTSVREDLSTEVQSYDVTNTVTLACSEFNITASATTAVRPIKGSILNYETHGSGLYKSQELLGYSPTKIVAYREIVGSSAPEWLNISLEPLVFRGSWYARQSWENKPRDLSWSESYYQARLLNLSFRTQLTKSLTYQETASHFIGMADRNSLLNGATIVQMFAGNYTLKSKATAAWSSKRPSTSKSWLDFCSEDEATEANPDPETSDNESSDED